MRDPFEPNLLHSLKRPPRHVALLRASRIGDFVCATPAFRALRAALPNANITLIALPRMRSLAARTGWFDHFAAFPGWPGMAEQFFEAPTALRFLRTMQAERFDLAIQMHGSGVYSNPFALMLGARYTAGFVRPGDPPGRLDAALPLPQSGTETQRACALARFLGVPVDDEQPSLPLCPTDFNRAHDLLGEAAGPLIGLHPGAEDQAKRWDRRLFSRLGTVLAQRHHGTIVILGSEESRALCTAVAGDIEVSCLNLAGRTALPTAAAVVAQLDLLVTNDSGPAHFAYALRTPVVTIFLSTKPSEWAPPAHPSGELARGASARAAARLRATPVCCLTKPTLDEVAAAASRLLRWSGQRGNGRATPITAPSPGWPHRRPQGRA